ncbi:polysaccharide deacetylase family protein [Patescibacteria group bacterium]|nr:MAG: polysaccharide deacetylase family protein [Patescibacteria group bacterium]
MRFALLILAVMLAGAGCTPAPRPPVAPQLSPPASVAPVGELRVPVLMYHRVGVVPARDPYGLFVSTSTFRAQMQALKDDGWSVILLEELLYAFDGDNRGSGGEPIVLDKSVVITFDDGNRDTYTNAFPILKEFGYLATVFVMTGPVSNHATSYMTPEMLSELKEHDWGMQPHTRWHEILTRIPEAQAREEIVSSKEFLERELPHYRGYGEMGQNIFAFAYPNGEENEAVRALLREAGIDFAFTIREGTVTTSSDPMALPRVRMGEDHGVKKFLKRLRAFAGRE